MSTTYQTVSGEFHLILKIRGNPRAIEFFHRLMRRCDSDWPWKETNGGRLCQHCMGVVYSSPRINPEDIKIGAKQASKIGEGEVRVKILHYAPQAGCFAPDARVAPTMWVPKDLLEKLYSPNGREEVRKVMRGYDIPTPTHPAHPTQVIQ